MTFFDLCGTACCEDDLQLMDYIKGVTTRRTRLGVEVVRVHYTADPERDSEWAKLERRKYSSQAAWVAERVIRGRVIALDRSLAGLLLAGTHARRLGLGAKVTFVQADAHAIPLAANCVDRITCRCGIMFFNDTGLVVSEVLRVLKAGGRVAFLVWGSFEQPFFDATVGVVLRLV